jgi:tetratricopeptide (TPR) repeat protein
MGVHGADALQLDPPRPQVVTPMYGARVLTDHPTLAWPPRAGAAGYRVELLSGAEGREERVLWRAESKEPRLPYPEEEKVLTPGLKYRWRVAALLGEGKEERLLESKFFVASGEPAADLERARRLASGDDPGDWLLAAAVYEARGVHDKALPLYERLAARWPEAPNFQRALAAYYDRAGRPDRAKEARGRAAKLEATAP